VAGEWSPAAQPPVVREPHIGAIKLDIRDSESAAARIIASGALGELVGLEEAVDFEAKSELYDLDTPGGRYELAKDVSAFANASGGCLVIGLETVRAGDRDLDIVSALKPVPGDGAQPAQYSGVIREYVYPVPSDLQIEFVPHEGGPGGLLVIVVPSQHPDSGPFLICRVVEEGVDLKQIVAGFVQRQGDRNVPLSPEALQWRFRKGSDTISVRLGRIEDKLDAMLDQAEAPAPGGRPDTEELKRRIAAILEI
jgi:hypothetical protein